MTAGWGVIADYINAADAAEAWLERNDLNA
jgi:hypothetical protein